MNSSPERLSPPSISEQQLIYEICSAPNAFEAHCLFEKNVEALKDWQVVFAEESDAGSIKLMDFALGPSGIATSVFRGRSLWLMDAQFVSQSGPVGFRGGSAVFVDSNAATYIQDIAYQEAPSQQALNWAHLINQIGPKLQQLNPFLYLWESLRSWNSKTIAECTKTAAAIFALSSSGSKLTAEWGRRYRIEFRESAEIFASGLIAEFEREVKTGRFAGLREQLDLIESVLIRTKIIELSSKKSKEHKLEQLVVYMHEKLSTIMLRELIVCGDILIRSNRSRISQKLNSIQDQVDPLKLISNCAWDMYISRALDALTSITPDQIPHLDFYVAEVLSCDGDVSDIINTTKLRAIAVHRPTKMNLPFFDSDIAEWLGNRVGPRRMSSLSDYFLPNAVLDRANRRHAASVQNTLQEDREEFMQLIRQLRR